MIQVRRARYRGVDGFKIIGRRRPTDYGVSIFTTTRSSADKIAARCRAGLEIRPDDWLPSPTESTLL